MKKFALLTALVLIVNMLAIPCVSFAAESFDYSFITESGSLVPSVSSDAKKTVLNGIGICADSVADTSSSYIDFDIPGGIDGSYEVTVSYKEFKNGFFNVSYTDVTGAKRIAGTVYVSGESGISDVGLTETLQTTFVLENASLDGTADFRIDTITDTNDTKHGFSQTSVYITTVAVAASADIHNVLPEITSQAAGNIFFDDDVPVFDIVYSEVLGQDTDFNASYTVKAVNADDSETVVQSGQKDFVVAENGSVSDRLVLNVDKYGLYKLYVTLTNDNGLSVKRTVDFSKSVKSGTVNPSLGTNIDFEYMTMTDDVIDLAKNAGLGIIRDTIIWNDYDRETGDKRRTVYEKKAQAFEKISDAGMQPMAVLGSHHWQKVFVPDTATGEPAADGNVIAYGEYLDGYTDFVNNLLNEDTFKDVTLYEIANEPNAKAFYDDETNTYVASGYIKNTGSTLTTDQTEVAQKLGKVYAKVAEATQKAVEESGRTDVKLGVLSLAFPSYKFTEVFSKTTLDYLNTQGVLGQFDAITYHPYENKKIPEVADENRVKTINELAAGYGGNVAGNAWHTEFGLSTSTYNDTNTNVCVSQFSQAKQLVRHYAASKGANPNDLYVQYNFVDNGARTNTIEANYGMLASNFAENPLAAKATYLAVANMNNKIGKANEYSQLVNTVVYDANGSTGDMVVKFSEAGTENATYMLWSLDGGSYSAIDGAKYYDIFGNLLDEADIISGGEIQLSDSPIYAVVTEATNEGVIRVSGTLATGEANVPVSVIVTGQKTLDDFAEGDILYINEGVSGINGTFGFTAPVAAEGYVNVYVSAEGCVPQRFYIAEAVEVSELTMTLVKGLSHAEAIEVQVNDLSDVKVIVQQTGNKEDVPNLIYALYNDKIFADVHMAAAVQGKNGNAFEYSLSVPEGKSFTRASVFLWDDNNKPVCSNITIGE